MVAGIVCLLAITAVAGYLWRRHGNRAVLIGWLWFVGTLIPVIGLVQVGWQSMADRYTYIPHMGLFIALVWGIGPTLNDKPARRGAFAIACVVAVALSALTARQLSYWRDSRALFSHALEVTDHNFIAHSQLAQALNDDAHEPDAAIAHYQEQFRIKPDPQPLYNIGRILAVQGRPGEAQRYYERAIAIKSDYADAILNLAHALGAQGRHAEAIEQYRRGLRLKEGAALARLDLALKLLAAGQVDEARAEMARAKRDAQEQGDSGLVDQIDDQFFHAFAKDAQQGGGVEQKHSPPLPMTTQSSENPTR